MWMERAGAMGMPHHERDVSIAVGAEGITIFGDCGQSTSRYRLT
jgi:hypothetical protein